MNLDRLLRLVLFQAEFPSRQHRGDGGANRWIRARFCFADSANAFPECQSKGGTMRLSSQHACRRCARPMQEVASIKPIGIAPGLVGRKNRPRQDVASQQAHKKTSGVACQIFFWAPVSINIEKRCNHYRLIVACMLSGSSRDRPVIVGWSTALRGQVINESSRATPEETGGRPAPAGKDRIITERIGDETGWTTARSLGEVGATRFSP